RRGPHHASLAISGITLRAPASRKRFGKTSLQPVSWLTVPERDEGIRAPGSHHFVAVHADACTVWVSADAGEVFGRARSRCIRVKSPWRSPSGVRCGQIYDRIYDCAARDRTTGTREDRKTGR